MVFRILYLVLLLLVTPIAIKATIAQTLVAPAGFLTIAAGDFTQSCDVAVTGIYGAGVITNAPPYNDRPNCAEYQLNVQTAGAYRLEIEYAADQPRPVQVSVNGLMIAANALADATGCWYPECQQWTTVGLVDLPAGPVTLRVEREHVFPHLRALRLTAMSVDEQPPGSTSGQPGTFRLILTPEGLDFDGARRLAEEMGGHLATLTNETERQAAWQVADDPAAWYVDASGNSIGPWLGGMRVGDGWAWVTGEPWSFTAFAPGEPNNSGGGEDRLHFFGQGSRPASNWNDIGHDAQLRGFVLEMAASPPANQPPGTPPQQGNVPGPDATDDGIPGQRNVRVGLAEIRALRGGGGATPPVNVPGHEKLGPAPQGGSFADNPYYGTPFDGAWLVRRGDTGRAWMLLVRYSAFGDVAFSVEPGRNLWGPLDRWTEDRTYGARPVVSLLDAVGMRVDIELDFTSPNRANATLRYADGVLFNDTVERTQCDLRFSESAEPGIAGCYWQPTDDWVLEQAWLEGHCRYGVPCYILVPEGWNY